MVCKKREKRERGLLYSLPSPPPPEKKRTVETRLANGVKKMTAVQGVGRYFTSLTINAVNFLPLNAKRQNWLF